jgi:pilus assembly protein CpaC
MAEDAVVLRGRAPNLATAEQAEALAAGYGKRVANCLEVAGGQQVQLQVRVAEISKSATRALGVNFGFTDGVTSFGSNVGQIAPLGFRSLGDSGGVDLGIPLSAGSAISLFGKGEIGNTTFAYFISALRDNNLLRVLAEPNLVAISGQEASFLAGGEFPIPVPQSSSGDSSTITIEYREFGVKLSFVPIVLGDGKIRLKVAPEVSDLDFTTAVRFEGFVVPGLSQRKVSTTVELNDGQTLAIAGLLNQTVTADRSVTPLLGDLPILGSLFRSVRYQRKETELVIFVTPRVVSAMNPNEVPPLPGEVWRHPTDVEVYLGADMGGPVRGSRTAPAPRYIGEHGFVPDGGAGIATAVAATPAAPATQPSN